VRDEDERRMLRLLKARLNGQFDDVMSLLGDPPDMNNLTDEFWTTEAGRMLADVRPELERLAMRATVAASAVASIPVIWDEAVIFAEAARRAASYGYDLIRGITDNTRQAVQEAVRRFVETPGRTIGQLRDELTPIFNERRAQTIAVTETTRAYSEGSELVRQQLGGSGINMEKMWRTSGDERVCPICGPNNDKPEREWTQVSGPPPAHPNCRCWVTLRVPR
jgi:hypothetical protein